MSKQNHLVFRTPSEENSIEHKKKVSSSCPPLNIIHSELLPSDAKLLQSLGPSKSMLGAMPYARHQRRLLFASDLERRSALVLMRTPDVYDIREQETVTRYIDAFTGEIRQHVWDFRVEYRDGRIELIYVKPAEFVFQKFHHQLFRNIADYVPKSVANDARTMTEYDVTAASVDLAELCNTALRIRVPGCFQAVVDFIRTAAIDLTVGTVVDAFVDALCPKLRPFQISSAYWSILIAVAHDLVSVTEAEHFSMTSRLSVSSRA